MTMYIMRPVRGEDMADVMELARLSGAGFTSLPEDENLVADKIAASMKAFSGETASDKSGQYFMMMEALDTGEVVGSSAVKCGTGIHRPFFNYRIITLSQASQSANKRFDLDALVLTNEYIGYVEVGTLFIKAEHRGGGAGRLAAQSRYLLMATNPLHFGDKVLAELRGIIDDAGNTPFWDCLGRHFFQMSFDEADMLSAVTDNQFILDLMPKYPIYIDLLPKEAQDVIGVCHPQGVGAMRLLEWEGFHFERTVDIFDGGPLVSTYTQNIRTIRDSRLVRVKTGESESPQTGLISTNAIKDFRAMSLLGHLQDTDTVILPRLQSEAMGLKEGDFARLWLKED